MAGHGPVQPITTRRRKVSIEIYFVLYLSAIILLLGTTPSHRNEREEDLERVVTELLGSNFRVRAERAALIHNIIPASTQLDTNGVLLRRDSINIITAQGTFSSVEFQLVSVTDSSTGRALPSERGRLTRRSDRSAVFQWVPSPNDPPGVYRVTVAGIATVVPPPTMPQASRDLVADILRRRGPARDSVTFTVTVFVVTDQAKLTHVIRIQEDARLADSANAAIAAARPPAAAPVGTPPGAPFELSPSELEVTAPQGRPWQTRVTLSGLGSMNDLDIQLGTPGVIISQRTPTAVMLTGTAPTSIGRQTVSLTARRRSDGRAATVSFAVRTVALPPPDVPQQLFSGQTHRLDFTASGIPSERMAVEVSVNGQIVLPRAQGSSVIDFRVPESGQVRFVRYLDNQYLDEATRDIRPLPRPSIPTVPVAQRDAKEVEIRTLSFGSVNGQQNLATLHIKSGNASEPELVRTEPDEKGTRFVQVWRVRRRDAREPFRFKMYAIDLRGSKTGKSEEVGFDTIQ